MVKKCHIDELIMLIVYSILFIWIIVLFVTDGVDTLTILITIIFIIPLITSLIDKLNSRCPTPEGE